MWKTNPLDSTNKHVHIILVDHQRTSESKTHTTMCLSDVQILHFTVNTILETAYFTSKENRETSCNENTVVINKGASVFILSL